MKLHLGCGNNYMQGWVNVDYSPAVKTDLLVDLSIYPWPFSDESVEAIYADQFLEHLENTPRVMHEVYRILKPNGIFYGQVPYCGSVWAFIDPTHKAFFCERSFTYYDTNRPGNTQNLGTNFSKVVTKLVGNTNTVLAWLRNLIPFRSLLKWFLWNMYDGVQFKLTK